jgi:hypothetical protein
MSPSQIVLILLTLIAFAYTVLAYPNKYGALTGRSRMFRTVAIAILDLLLLLVLMATFIDFRAGVSPRLVPIRFFFYVASCFFLCFSLVAVAALDALESFSSVRRERRNELERVLRDEISKARAEFAAQESKAPVESSGDDGNKLNPS